MQPNNTSAATTNDYLKPPTKYASMSAAVTPAFAVGADRTFQYHGRRTKSKSPTPTTGKSRHDQGFSRDARSLSPMGGHHQQHQHPLDPKASKQNLMVCHQSAHAIVFRDHLRLARKIIQEVEEDDEDDDDEYYPDELDRGSSWDDDEENGQDEFEEQKRPHSIGSIRGGAGTMESKEVVKEINHLAHDLVPELKAVTIDLKSVSERSFEIEGLHAHITPLDELEWNLKTEYKPLLQEQPQDDWTPAEREVYEMLRDQQACVKTIQRLEWPSFLKRFQQAVTKQGRSGQKHFDIPPGSEDGGTLNSFVTSTSLLPSEGRKMRCYGTELSYPVGVVFALPKFDSPQAEQEAVAETQTWAWPAGYAAKTEFNINDRGQLINGRDQALVTLEQIRQYNHEYLTCSDHYIAGRVIQGGFNVVPYNECFLRVGGPGRIVQGRDTVTGQPAVRSLDKGVGLFVALFIRTISMADIINLFRTKARIAHLWGGDEYFQDIPLLYLHHDHGVRVFTRSMQNEFWKQASCRLQPFPNPMWALTTKYHETNEKSLDYKMQELLDLDDAMSAHLSHHELAKIAGGFGVSDRAFLTLIQRQPDFQRVHDVMQQGFAASIRANDYYTARQMLVLYSLANTFEGGTVEAMQEKLHGIPAVSYADLSVLKQRDCNMKKLPAPLATKRWRRATNSHGLLVVLGAAQILKTITTTSAKRRTDESVEAVEEWVQHGEESVVFRVASWREQRADEADTNIAMSTDAKFMAFVTNKSVTNRRKFAQQLRKAAPENDFTSVGFLQGIYDIVDHMHSPCMRLELLQYILALDNRYSVELIKESIQLAATCLSVVPTK